MKLWAWLLVLLGLACCAQVSEPAPNAASKSFSSPAPAPSAVPTTGSIQQRRVTILVTATDKSGKPLPELTKEQVTVTDNDQGGQILEVRSAAQLPLRLGIVLLASKTTFAQQQAAAIDLVRKVVRPGIDAAFMVSAGGDKAWSGERIDWQSDLSALEKAIQDLHNNTGFPDPFSFALSEYNVGSDRMAIQQYAHRYSETSGDIFNIMWSMMKSDPRPARRAVVMFRNPWAHSPGWGQRLQQIVDEHNNRIVANAQQLWTSLYIVGINEPSAAPTKLSQSYNSTLTGEAAGVRSYDEAMEKEKDRLYNAGKSNIDRLAEETGGRVWWSLKKNYSEAVAGIANALNGAQAISYSVPLSSSTNPQHLLQVRTNAPGTRIVAQKTYFSRQNATPQSTDASNSQSKPK